MRNLQFVVDNQVITKDPDCDFSNLVIGTSGYVRASFKFSDEWDGFRKVVEFSSGRKEYSPQILGDNESCIIPGEVLKRPIFNIRVLGKRQDIILRTNTVQVRQRGGK